MTVTKEFADEMGENPLGDRDRLKAVSGHIVEQYSNPIGTLGRRRRGEPEAGVVEVYEKVPEDEDYYRNWRRVGHLFADTLEEAREAYESLTDAEAVEEWCNENPGE